MRQETNYKGKRFTGFTPYPKAAAAEIWRLTSPAGGRVVDVIMAKSVGRRVEMGEPFLEVTEPISVKQIAELCCFDERTIQRELKDLKQRKIIASTETGKGFYEFRALFRDWASLPDYKPGPMVEPEGESDDEPPEDDPAQNAKEETVTQLTRKPVKIAAGKKSKPVKIECGVTGLQFLANVDAECSAVVQGGVLLVNLQYENAAKSQSGQTNEINDLTSFPRQPSRGDPNSVRGKGTKGERRSNSETCSDSVQHPRAEELSKLFDPLLLKSCGKSLSGDSVMLLAACEAISGAPHDYVVKCVVDRAARELKLTHVKHLCKEIAHNWEKSKGLPVKKELTREEMDAMVARDRAARLAKQRTS